MLSVLRNLFILFMFWVAIFWYIKTQDCRARGYEFYDYGRCGRTFYEAQK